MHKHGRFHRTLYTIEAVYQLWIYRFRCPQCKKTAGLLPCFMLPHQTAGLDIQEKAIEQESEGQSQEKIADTTIAGTSSYSVKTVRRWLTHWKKWEKQWGNDTRALLLQRYPFLDLPIGAKKPRTNLGWLLCLWQECLQKDKRLSGGLLQWIQSQKK
ncbi:DUF6431 domain-containing protein [Heliorestis convoluta]|uniref:DUF6431 domain-containing protein n=1 Tax=Heliorestis convoluta TaxID=356322 RepID=UPI00129A30F1|nr:DUF6431 domain-containing protein [Heliorestis convoluta]